MNEETPEEVRMAYYLPKVVEEAVRLHHPEVFIGDMIQEGNIVLMLALKEIQKEKNEEEIWNRYVPECWQRWSRRQK